MSTTPTRKIENLTRHLRIARRKRITAEIVKGRRHPSYVKANASVQRIENAILRARMQTPTRNDITSVSEKELS